MLDQLPLGRSLNGPPRGENRIALYLEEFFEFFAQNIDPSGCGWWYKRGTKVRQRGGTNGLPELSSVRVQCEAKLSEA